MVTQTWIKRGAIFATDDRPVRPLSPSTSLACKFLRDRGPVLVAEANEYPSVYGTLEDAEQCLSAGLARAEADGERVLSGEIIQHERMHKVRIIVERGEGSSDA